jgi:hypothetical protein
MSNIFDDKIDVTLKSIDGIAKASPKPFLLTRINAGLNSAAAETVWSQIAFYLKKPLVSGFAILLLVLVNILVIKSINNGSEKEKVTKSLTFQKYDFAINVSVLYDIENQEP